MFRIPVVTVGSFNEELKFTQEQTVQHNFQFQIWVPSSCKLWFVGSTTQRNVLKLMQCDLPHKKANLSRVRQMRLRHKWITFTDLYFNVNETLFEIVLATLVILIISRCLSFNATVLRHIWNMQVTLPIYSLLQSYLKLHMFRWRHDACTCVLIHVE